MHLQKQQKVCMVVCSLMEKLLWQPKNGGVYRPMNLCCFPSCCRLWPPAHPEIFQCTSQTAIQQYGSFSLVIAQIYENNTPTQPPYFSLLLHCVSLIFVSFNFVDLVKITDLRAHEFVASDPIEKNNSQESELYQQCVCE